MYEFSKNRIFHMLNENIKFNSVKHKKLIIIKHISKTLNLMKKQKHFLSFLNCKNSNTLNQMITKFCIKIMMYIAVP